MVGDDPRVYREPGIPTVLRYGDLVGWADPKSPASLFMVVDVQQGRVPSGERLIAMLHVNGGLPSSPYVTPASRLRRVRIDE
jgi:hypothetical protein